MGKKKIEHIVFDGTRKPKKSLNFRQTNTKNGKKFGENNHPSIKKN
ncbi:MAG: hypothetical protein Q4C42_07950 [Clostridia bacterium]|nr:hypothetical protein [Clostridia bacterium]